MVDLGIGDRCNSSCIMCTTVRPEDKKVENRMLSKEEVFSMIDKMERPPYIAITGGEPTIRKDLTEIVGHARNRFPAAEIKLLTNARMASYPDYANDLLSTGIDVYIIPLHSHHPDLHDFVTRTKGSFVQTVQGIRNLSKAKIEIRIVIHGINYPFLPETAEFIRDNFPGASVVMIYFDIIGSAFINRDRLVVQMTRIAPYLEKAIDVLQQNDIHTYHFPLCVLGLRYRDSAKGVTVVGHRIMFADSCAACSMKSKCCGIWKAYAKLVGTGEFKPI
ncbi:MAG: radical SAM protein [Candidatus Woesearchaeota archaeon]